MECSASDKNEPIPLKIRTRCTWKFSCCVNMLERGLQALEGETCR